MMDNGKPNGMILRPNTAGMTLKPNTAGMTLKPNPNGIIPRPSTNPITGSGGGASARLVGPGGENPNSIKATPNFNPAKPNPLFNASTPTRPTLIAGNPKPVMNLLSRSSSPLFGSLTKKL